MIADRLIATLHAKTDTTHDVLVEVDRTLYLIVGVKSDDDFCGGERGRIILTTVAAQ